MKIQIVKKADRKPSDPAGCVWLIDGLPEPPK